MIETSRRLLGRTGPTGLWATGLIVAIAILAIVLAIASEGSTTVAWGISGRDALWTPPPVPVPSTVSAVALGAAAILLAVFLATRGTTQHRGLLFFAPVLIFLSFLITAGAGQTVSLTAFVNDALIRSVPLVLAALGGIISERTGVINVAIEGQLLLAAFAAAVAGSITGGPWYGILAGMFAGVVVAALLGALATRFLADQLVVGIVINVAVSGVTTFLVSGLFIDNPGLNRSRILPNIDIPALSQIPVIGPLLFGGSPFLLIAIVLAAVIIYVLDFTRLGLHLTAVGENPRAADAAGMNVLRIRFLAVLAGGLVVGIAGAYFTVGSVGSFSQDMTGGRGFIALAAIILGGWRPKGAIAAALLFGAADAFQSLLSILGTPVPSALLLTLPYVVTVIALVMMRGRIHAPSADGVPYKRD